MGCGADNFGNDPDSLPTFSLSLTLNFEKSTPIGLDHIAALILQLPISILQIEVTVCGEMTCMAKVCSLRVLFLSSFVVFLCLFI